mmetsp:Transcript_8380/g.10765  ORF Transcript_8380/g.10765 Transcript_8380/m.10765 type:complete len:536 (+) Transcript_8380:148-1755(+)
MTNSWSKCTAIVAVVAAFSFSPSNAYVLSNRARKIPASSERMHSSMLFARESHHQPGNASNEEENLKDPAELEIENIMRSENPPFNARYEVKKFLKSNPKNLILEATGMDPASAEYKEENKLMNLESAMHEAIDNLDWKEAAAKRDEIDRMHIDDCGRVISLNTAFYQAFTEKDSDTMSDLWMKSEAVQCIHPSHHTPLVGYKAVCDSWSKMFESDDKSFQKNIMEPNNIKLSVRGTTAWLTCDEEVYTNKYVSGEGRTKQLAKRFRATNIFRKVNGKWCIVHHHATYWDDTDASFNALTGRIGKRSKGRNPSSSGVISLSGLDALSGLSGSSGFGKDSSRGVKRVFMGSLSDLLAGSLDEIVGSNDDDSLELDDIDDSSTLERRIIEVDDEEDGDSEDDDHLRSSKLKRQPSNGEDSLSSSSTSNVSRNGLPKDALRQNCIAALRRLCNQGAISQKQKRVLLTDIITCSAKGEFSMVEVAYELLCGDDDELNEDHEQVDQDIIEAADEEFADQCRVFANDLSSQSSPMTSVGGQ